MAKTSTPTDPGPNRVLQIILLLGVVVPYILIHQGIVLAGSDAQARLLSGDLGAVFFADSVGPLGTLVQRFVADQRLQILVACLATPHVWYFIVWTNAGIFKRACLSSSILRMFGKPFEIFAQSAHLIKLFQALVFVWWYFEQATLDQALADPAASLEALKSFFINRHIIALLVGGQLMFLGQLFNAGVYSAIGEAGVYYGTRLGETIPWVFGFPFNVVPHPQYLGATLSIWGMLLVIATPYHVEHGLYAVGGFMTVFYAFSSYVEACL